MISAPARQPEPVGPASASPENASASGREAFHHDLAQRFGTPFYAYDAAEIERRAAEIREVLPAPGSSRLLFSFKSNPLASVAEETRRAGCEADLTSPGELAAAYEAGFDFACALYGGPGKGEDELRHAIDTGVRHFSVESENDLAALRGAAEGADVEVKALLRINPGEAPRAKLAMSGVASQFGFEENVLRERGAAVVAAAGEHVRPVGIHIYWGTQIGETDALLASFAKTVEIAEAISAGAGFPLEILNFGGGFPWPYAHAGRGPDLSVMREGLAALHRDAGAARDAQWWFESGRHLVASSGTLVTRVMDVKDSKDEKRYLVLDTGIHHLGGMSGLGRIPRFSIELEPPAARRGNEVETFDVVGQLCTPLDCMGRRIELPTVEPGDLLAIPNVGAYGPTASVTHFLSRSTPAEIVHRDGSVVAAHRLRGGHERLD